MTCGAVYGDVADPRFAGIWPANDRRLACSAGDILDSNADYQRRFNAQVTGWARPSYVSVSGDERYYYPICVRAEAAPESASPFSS